MTDVLKRVVLFGGNDPMVVLAGAALARGLDVVLFSDPFRLEMVVNDRGTLAENLHNLGIAPQVRDSITAADVAPFVDQGTVGLSACTFWIFKPDVIRLFGGRLYNYHGALLPRERGAGPFTWRILSQSRAGGLAVHTVDEGIDTGGVVFSREFTFPAECRIPRDYQRFVAPIERDFLNAFIARVTETPSLPPARQPEAFAQYWPALNTAVNGFIDWTWTAAEIETFVNAFDDPYLGAATFLRGQQFRLKGCFLDPSHGLFHPFQAGIVVRVSDGHVYVAARGGLLVFREVIPDGATITVRPGHRFHTPAAVLEHARTARVKYDSKGFVELKD